jgi:1-acyl-sn-glycerol-3-phosphate acyltransferase
MTGLLNIKVKAFSGSAIFFVSALLTGILTSIIVIIIAPFSDSCAYKTGQCWCSLTLKSLKLFCGLSYRVEGQHNIPNEPCVIAIRHSSAWETFAQAVIFPRQSWVMKKELIFLPLFGLAWISLKPITINRKSGRKAVKKIIQLGVQYLQKGRCVNIFPESTRMDENTIGRFGQSAALLAENANCLILPVTHNAGKFWKRRGFIKYPGKITMRIGPPISTNGKHHTDTTEEIKKWIGENKPI